MRLRELDAQFVGHHTARSYQRLGDRIVAGVQGVLFQCPLCAQGKEAGEEDGRRFARGAHYVLCWFTNPVNAERVPDDAFPRPGRWQFSGTSIDDLTLSPSVHLRPDAPVDPRDCQWHGWVKNGDAA